MGSHPTRDDIDLLEGGFYVDDPHEKYTWMREHAPVYFDAKNGVWGIASYAALLAMEKDPLTFSNAGGIRGSTHRLHHRTDDRARRLDLPVPQLLEHIRQLRQRGVDRGEQRAVIRHDREPTSGDDLSRTPLPRDDAFEHLTGEAVGQFPGLDERDEF